MSPVFPFRTLLALALPIAIAAAVLAVVGKRGTSVFKKQGVAWGLTLLMVFAAIGIGYARGPMAGTPEPRPETPNAPASAQSYVWDNARVLSAQDVRALDQRNQRLWDRYSVSIGVVTCNYGGDDLYDYAMQCAEDMELGGYDMIVALDITGDNYWLLQGNDIRRDFTDQDCSDYAYEYLEYDFARGMYGNAALDLTEALESWYENYFD